MARLRLAAAFALAAASSAWGADARAIIAEMQAKLRADTSYARYTMRIVRPSWTRTLRFEAWDDRKGKRFFIHILAPRKEKDTTWLKRGRELWMYLPRVEREIRIPPAMMQASWMGSDFTNDDLVKMDELVDDYDHEIVRETAEGWLIRSRPKPDAPVVWGMIEHEITRALIPRRARYYDEAGKLVRTLEFLEPKRMDGRLIPTHWIVHPTERPREFTEMILEAIRFNIPVNEAMFSRARLRGPWR